MKAPKLHVVPFPAYSPELRIITVRRGQWDEIIAEAYNKGWHVIEMDENDKPVRAYQKQGIYENN